MTKRPKSLEHEKRGKSASEPPPRVFPAQRDAPQYHPNRDLYQLRTVSGCGCYEALFFFFFFFFFFVLACRSPRGSDRALPRLCHLDREHRRSVECGAGPRARGTFCCCAAVLSRRCCRAATPSPAERGFRCCGAQHLFGPWSGCSVCRTDAR